MIENLIRPVDDDSREYLRDESRSIGHAEYIAFPKNEEQIRDIVKYCNERKIAVTIQGARTGLAAAAVPQGGCVLNLSYMNRITGMKKNGDRYVLTVQPGVVLSQLKKALAGKKFDTDGWNESDIAAYTAFAHDGEYFFSPDPTEASATIGGMTACNASGARSYHYGPTRNYINALRVVLADGRTIALRRGERYAKGYQAELICEDGSVFTAPVPGYQMPDTKNASGYYARKDMDLIDLLIGSDGTLGVISEIEIILLPLPAVIWGVTCLFTEETQSLRFVDSIRKSVQRSASMEFFDEGALRVLREQKKRSAAFSALLEIPDEITTAVYVELHTDTEDEAAELLFTIGDACAKAGGCEENSWVARNSSDLDKLMFFRHAVPESVNMLIDERKKTEPTITKLGSDMSVPDQYLFDVVALYRRTLQEKNLESAVWGHVGNNHLHVNVLPRNREDYHKAKELFLEWAGEITKMGGAVSAEHGVGKLKSSFLTVMYGEEHIDEMRALKKAFDPNHLLGIGNMFDSKEVQK